MKLIEHNGRKLTLTELSRLCGISRAALRSRYAQGERGAALIREPVQGTGRPKLIEYKGRRVTIKDLAQATGINSHTLRWRCGRGQRGDELVKRPGWRVT